MTIDDNKKLYTDLTYVPVKRMPSKSPALLIFKDKFSRNWDNWKKKKH